MKAIGRPELADDPRYASNADRAEHADELDDLIEGWTGRHGAEEIQRILDEAAVPAGPIYSVTDILNDEQYQARGMILEGEVEGVGKVKMPGLVPKLSETPGRTEWYGGVSEPTTRRSTAGSSASPTRRSSTSRKKGRSDAKSPKLRPAPMGASHLSEANRQGREPPPGRPRPGAAARG